MKVFTYIFVLFFSCHALGKQALSVAIAEWDGYTNLDGTGVYNQLIKEIFTDYEVNLEFNSYTRNIYAFENNQVDLVVGVFREDINKALFPRWYLDIEYPVKAFYNKSIRSINHPLQLENLSISWLRGYSFEKYIDVNHQSYLLNSVKSGFDLLAKNRIDVFVDYEYNMPKKYGNSLGSFELLGKRKIYIAFQNNKRGMELSALFDRKMQEYRDSGKLAKIYNIAHSNGYRHAEFEYFQPSQPHIVIRTRDTSLLKHSKIESYDSLEAKLLKTIFERMSEFDIETAKYEILSSDVESYGDSKNTCLANKVKNKERERHFVFSDSFVMYPGLHLYSKVPLKVNVEKISLQRLFKQYPNLKLGIVEGQFYSEKLNKAISEIPSKHLMNIETFNVSKLKRLNDGSVDLLIEFPTVINNYWPYVSKDNLYSYRIEGARNKTVGYLMCSDSPQNNKFLAEFNKTLNVFKNEPLFFQLHQLDARNIDKQSFTALFKEAFQLPFE